MKTISDKLFSSLLVSGLLVCSFAGCQWLNFQSSVGNWERSRSFMHAGDSAMKSGQHAKAIKQFEEAAKLTPNDPVIYQRLSEGNRKLGHSTGAINQLARAVETSDYDAQLLFKFASLNYQYGNLPQAFQAVNHALQEDPQLIEARILRADVYVEQSAYSKALQDLHFVLGVLGEEDIQRQVEMQLKVAEIYIQQQRFQSALSIVTTIAVTKIEDEQVIKVYQIHSLILQQLNRLKDAQEKLELALKLDGDHVETYYRLAEVHTAANNMPGAALAIRQTLALSPSHQAALQLSQRISDLR